MVYNCHIKTATATALRSETFDSHDPQRIAAPGVEFNLLHMNLLAAPRTRVGAATARCTAGEMC